MKDFDPNSIGLLNGNLFGLPFSADEAKLVFIPVPWEVTTSYGQGTAAGPKAVLDASLQVDLYDPDVKDAWKLGIAMLPVSKKLISQNSVLQKKAQTCISHLAKGGSPNDAKLSKLYDDVNKGCAEMNNFVKSQAEKLLKQGKIPCVLGGEHSSPLGLMQALTEKYAGYSILHIDAHADLRKSYEGFEFSHASIMRNAMKIKNIEKLVQVSVRDFCEEEAEFIEKSKGRIVLFESMELKRKMFEGAKWKDLCAQIIASLSKNVYVSFDIDGLSSELCPNTGTPVPGGLSFEQAVYLLEILADSGKKIIGFDLCEVAVSKTDEWVASHSSVFDEWDATVGARILYKLANLTLFHTRR